MVVCKEKSDDADKVVYSYGFETMEQSDEVKFCRKNKTFTLIKSAHNDNEKIAARLLFRQLYRVIIEENCPDERQIAIG